MRDADLCRHFSSATKPVEKSLCDVFGANVLVQTREASVVPRNARE